MYYIFQRMSYLKQFYLTCIGTSWAVGWESGTSEFDYDSEGCDDKMIIDTSCFLYRISSFLTVLGESLVTIRFDSVSHDLIPKRFLIYIFYYYL